MKARGYTLIETMFGIAILILLIFALMGIYIQFGKLYSLSQAGAESQDQTRRVIGGISPYAIQANGVALNYTVDGSTYVSGTSTLVLQLPAIDINGSVIDSAWDYVIYHVTGTQFFRQIVPNVLSARASSTKLLSGSVANITFTYDPFTTLPDSTFIVASTTAVTTNNNVTVTSSATEVMVLRNNQP